MVRTTLFGAVGLLAIGLPFSAYAQCGDMTLCMKNPPFPPAPPTCTTYTNYCAYVQPNVRMKLQLPEEMKPPEAQVQQQPQNGEPQQPQQPSQSAYSLQLNNLSRDQLQALLGHLGLDTSKVQLPK